MSCYALRDPRTKAVRYVGMSGYPGERFKSHCRRPRAGKLRDWILELRGAGLKPELEILPGRTEARWIKSLRPDLNINRGSDSNRPVGGYLRTAVTWRPDPALMLRVARLAESGLWSISAWLTLAAKEKLARDEKTEREKGKAA